MKEYTGDALRNAPKVIIKKDDPFDFLVLPPFNPNQNLVTAIKVALMQRWPLLITGEKYRRDIVGKTIAFELYGNNFLDHYYKWMLRKQATFRSGIYTYDHESRKRDLEYHQLDPGNNPIRTADYYLQTGTLLAVLQAIEEEYPDIPIMEISSVHEADENFIADLMEFLLTVRQVEIPETDFVFIREAHPYTLPIIILTAEPGYQLPKNFEGMIYTCEIPFPQKEMLLNELLAHQGALVVRGNLAMGEDGTPLPQSEIPEEAYLRHSPQFPAISILVEKLVDLFYLIKDSSLLRPGNSQFPMTILELENTINYKISDIVRHGKPVAETVQEVEELLASQYELAQSGDLGQSVQAIKEAIEKARMDDAILSLELIKGQLPTDLQNEAIQFISRHNELTKIENMGTESSLLLFPQKNKLSFDLLKFLGRL